MNVLQSGALVATGPALVVWLVGHLAACVVAAAAAEGAAGRWLRPVRIAVGGVALAVVVPAIAVGARRLGVLDAVAGGAAGPPVGPYVAAAGAVGVGAVAVASAAADAELSDPGYPSAAAALRAHLSGDDAVGVVVGTVALVSGEAATLAVVNAL
ncbi:hypothetical protein [Halobaculum lipolyticum]|uniref:Uncharacterized protein n=1 Tax=Halobaculum lipolyticum TaxID=3032001 RepID=A0ABD5WAI5_9EURY|nr:hypothetical protein [Halobaculum sp. DT31]